MFPGRGACLKREHDSDVGARFACEVGTNLKGIFQLPQASTNALASSEPRLKKTAKPQAANRPGRTANQSAERLEREVRLRDTECVYCRVPMSRPAATGPRASAATWGAHHQRRRGHYRENIALCCSSCNSSKGTRQLSAWLDSSYCKRRGMTKDTVADVVKHALRGRS